MPDATDADMGLEPSLLTDSDMGITSPFEAAAARIRARYPTRAPDPASLAASQVPAEQFWPAVAGEAVERAATLPKRATEAADAAFTAPEQYDPGPVMEAARWGITGGMPLARPGALGIAGGKLTIPEAASHAPPQFAKGGRVGGSQKVTRDAFLYLGPKGDKQCGTCRDWVSKDNRCRILGPSVNVTASMSCGLYVYGTPLRPGNPTKAIVTPEEAGLVDRKVRCENCRWGGSECGLYKLLNEQQPDIFDLDTKIHPKGCCNAQEPK